MRTMPPKLSNPHWYFGEYVEPAVRDFLDDPLTRHKAVAAMSAAHHFWERLEKYYRQEELTQYLYGQKGGNFQSYLERICPDLTLLRYAAEAVKHQRGRERFTATGSTMVTEGGLVIDPSGRTVVDVLNSVMSFWRQWLIDHPNK